MAIAVQDVLKRTDDLLLDANRVRWTEAERIRWINEAATAIIVRRPAARAVSTVVALVAGTLQTIPASGVQLLDVVRNVSATGAPGRAVRRTDRQLLDDVDPDWHSAKQKGTVKHFTFDDRDPTTFYVYPPAIVGTKVLLLHSELPAALAETDTSGSLDLPGQYLEPVVNYVCYRANAKDSEFANTAAATAFYQAFMDALGLQSQAQMNASPNQPTTSV